MRKLWALMLCTLLLVMASPVGAVPSPELIVRVGDLAGKPLAGAAVEVYRLDQGLISVQAAGEDGVVRLPYGEQPQLWLLRVSAVGYRVQETGWFDPAYGGARAVGLEPMGGDLQVLLRTKSGEPLTADVTLLTANGQLLAQEKAQTGRFSRNGLMPGEYQLLATAAGYGPLSRRIIISSGRTTVESLTLAASHFSAVGEVVDRVTGKPVVGARVEIVRNDHVVPASGTTGPTGRFSLSASHTGAAYHLRVSAPGYIPATTESQEVGLGRNLDYSGAAQIRLSPVAGVIEGSLLNQSGMPIPNTRVVLLRQGFGEVAATTTGPSGEFRFEGLAAGAVYRYKAVADEAFDNVNAGWHDLVASDWIEAKPGVTVQTSVVAQSWVKFPLGHGMVSGRVVTPEGLPVEGATVELIRHTRIAHTTTTDAAGSFSFANLEASEKDGVGLAPYTIRIAKEGFMPTREVTLAGEPQTTFGLPVRARLILEATLRPAHVVPRGRVTDPFGQPVPGAQVALTVNDQTAVVQATTDTAGWYQLLEIPASLTAATLKVTAPGYLPTGQIDVAEPLTRSGSLPTVRMTPRQSVLEGIVTDFRGVPLAGVAVTLWGRDRPLAEVLSDAQGFYRVEADLTAEPIPLLTAEREGYTRSGAVLTQLPGPGERTSLSLLLQPTGAVVEGRVLDKTGRPVAAAEVEFIREGSGVVHRALSAPDGRYRFETPLPEGGTWVWLRVRPVPGSFGGSLQHGLDYVPLTRLTSGDHLVLDLLVRP